MLFCFLFYFFKELVVLEFLDINFITKKLVEMGSFKGIKNFEILSNEPFK